MNLKRHLVAAALLLAVAAAACASQADREVTQEEASATASSLGLVPESFALSDRVSPSPTDEASTDATGTASDLSEDEQPGDEERIDPLDIDRPPGYAPFYSHPEQVVESSEDCVRPRKQLSLPPGEFADRYPVIQLAIEGRLQEAHAQDPTLDLEESVSDDILSPLVWALEMHCHELFDWLVDRDILEGDWMERFRYPGKAFWLVSALEYDNVHAVKVLLERGHDANALDGHGDTTRDGAGWPMLYFARSAEAVQLLLDAGADPNRDRFRAIDWFARNGDADIVELLYSLTDNPSTAIFQAIRRSAFSEWYTPEEHTYYVEKSLEVLRTLRSLGADINFPRPVQEGSDLMPEVTSAVDFAREWGSRGFDPAVIAFLEDWAAE